MPKLCPNCDEEIRHNLCPTCGEEFRKETETFEVDTFDNDTDSLGASEWGSEFEFGGDD